jgi:CubicO group peptidase (beta-lactamase class C family)
MHKSFLSPDSLSFKPGDRWDYCNVNYMLLTKIVEKLSCQSFSRFSRQQLFDPLAMTSTVINDDVTEIIKNRVTPYNKRTAEYVAAYLKEGIHIDSTGEWIQHPRSSPTVGGSGVVTTVNDLIKWSENFFTKKFGGQAFYDLMHQTMHFKNGKDNQAFGLYIDQYKGRTFVAWDGGDFGISAQIMRFTKAKVAIIVLSNLGSGEAYLKADEIADILIDERDL